MTNTIAANRAGRSQPLVGCTMTNRYQPAPSTVRRGRCTRRIVVRTLAGFAGAAALIGAGTAQGRSVTAQQPTGPGSTIEQFYADIATYQYKDAYALLGSDLQAKQSYVDFIKGYADTAFVQMQFGDVTGSTDQNNVPVFITAWHNDGSIHAYRGSYTLTETGAGWKITAASIAEVAPPSNVAPLMRFADIDVKLGQPEAAMGHRYFHLLATNTAPDTVMAAGVPQLTVLDASGNIVVESSPSQTPPISPVELRSGATADAMFEWSNWCQATPAYPLQLRIAIPGDTARATIPYTTPLGPVQAPPCFGNAEPTTFQCRAFQAATP